MNRNIIPQVQASSVGLRANSTADIFNRQQQQQQQPWVAEIRDLRRQHAVITAELRRLTDQQTFSVMTRFRQTWPKDKHLQGIVRNTIKSYPEQFDMNIAGMLTGTNRAVYNGIKEALVLSSYYKEKICDADGKKKKREQLELAVLRASNMRNCLKARRNRKLKKRVDALATNLDFIAAEMEIPANECKAFVVAGCMSEEEDDEIDTYTDKAISIKVVVPGWRSETLLDDPRVHRTNYSAPSKPRTSEVRPLNIPAKVVQMRLPGWGFQ
ncbi:hypothetical protein BD770DRAFT_449849 [Pilaira anomala]|nr:hypothetical protein BD770DRAFT_449849 [Pilaira anomala]